METQDDKVDVCFHSPRLFYAADLLSKLEVGPNLTSDQLGAVELSINDPKTPVIASSLKLVGVLEITVKKLISNSITSDKDDPIYSMKEWLCELVENSMIRADRGSDCTADYHQFKVGQLNFDGEMIDLTGVPLNHSIQLDIEYVKVDQ